MNRIEAQKMREFLKVYFIMGSTNCKKDPDKVLKEAIAGGITIYQFREKGINALDGKDKLELAFTLRGVCKEHNIPFIVNDDIDLALAVDADGVHIGQEDDVVNRVRKKIGDKILGVSVHNLQEAEEALRRGADYFGVGPIYPTSTKTDTNPVQGVSFLKKLRAKGYTVPIVGIGGITVENASAVTEAGANGVSVITALTNAINITHEAKKLAEEASVGLNKAASK
ncbi:thiamine phosphate synthase [Bacillus sp. B15-48]|uniref:thiamine phosphate synthase n=1 Tax=Bacillus sp. B15-48 TaxID=1548601 RepID=UPI00193FE156|nr:thiamine phosphate synthase [Bacillus sp. B15-48]MBM4762681.1 thiamine phosphate synthase [Bacillus sp. B15-48]